MRHQELSAALQEALAEAKKRFEPQDGGYHARFRKPRYSITRKGIRCSAEQWSPPYQMEVPELATTIEVDGNWRTFSTTYTWEELLP